jgi:hypothetical protein
MAHVLRLRRVNNQTLESKMAKPQALIFAEAQIQNQNAAIAALEAKMGELLLALAAKPAAVQPEAPAVEQPAKRVDDWLPRYDACNFSRPVIAVFDDFDEAFAYRAHRAQETGDTVAVRKCRSPLGYAVAAVY